MQYLNNFQTASIAKDLNTFIKYLLQHWQAIIIRVDAFSSLQDYSRTIIIISVEGCSHFAVQVYSLLFVDCVQD